jgi:citrate synthase
LKKDEDRTRPWWQTSIVDIGTNKVLIRGYRIEDLIGRVSYAEMLYLEIMGELPSQAVGELLTAVLVSTCDFGVYSPAIASARMAATCGISFNSCLANGMNVLGDIHGGAAENAMRLYYEIVEEAERSEQSTLTLVESRCRDYRRKGLYLPGFGHPVNDNCPRVRRLIELGQRATGQGLIDGRYIAVAREIEQTLARVANKRIPMNVDGAVAAIQCELGLPWQAAKGIFCLSRGIGLLAHAYEELASGSRLKGPCPPDVMAEEVQYVGPPERDLPNRRETVEGNPLH